MNAQPSLEGKVDTLIESLNAPAAAPLPAFNEPRAHDGFGMPNIGGMFKVANANLLVITLGVILSSTIGGWLTGMLPSVGKYATVMAGAVLLLVFKSGVARDFASGVLIGGLAGLFSGIGSSLGGLTGGDMSMPMAEDRVTFGGSDGVRVSSPDRRVIS